MKTLSIALCAALLVAFAGCGSGPAAPAEEGPEAVVETPELVVEPPDLEPEEATEPAPAPAGPEEGPAAVPTVQVSDDASLAAVATGDRGWGFIDQSGAWAIAPQYRQAYGFSDGLAPVQLADNHWVFIDKHNQVVVQAREDLVVTSGFSEGIAAVAKDTYGNGTPGDLYGFIDRTGKVIAEPQYVRVYGFHEGLAAVEPENDSVYGFLDTAGNMAIPPDFLGPAHSFSEGLAYAELAAEWQPGTSELGRGYIDKNGQFVIEAKMDLKSPFGDTLTTFCEPMGDFRGGLAPAHVRTSMEPGSGFCWGVIDKTGATVFKGDYFRMYDFSEGLAAVDGTQDKPDAVGFVDGQGNVAIPFQEDWKVQADWGFSEGLCRVYRDGQVGYIDKSGNLVVQPQYYDSTDFSEGLAAVADSSYNWGYVDKSGKAVIALQFQGARPFTR